MARVPKSGLREVHIDIGSHNENPSPLYSVYLPGGGGYLSHRDRTEFTKRTAQKYAREFMEKHGKRAVVVPADEPPHLHAKNPAPRIGTARPRRASQITKKAPTKRLVARRSANTRKGYFPNPTESAEVIGSAKINKLVALTNNAVEVATQKAGDNLVRQARVSYAQGLVTALELLGVFHPTQAADMMETVREAQRVK